MLFSMFVALTVNATDLTLAGTKWSGSYSTLGQTGPISLEFRSKPNANGDLDYDFKPDFSGFPTPIAQSLAYLDSPCAYTPRTLHVEADGTGTITVYKCAETQDEETKLSTQRDRAPFGRGTVTRFVLDEERNAMVVKAKLFGLIRVTYRLTRVN